MFFPSCLVSITHSHNQSHSQVSSNTPSTRHKYTPLFKKHCYHTGTNKCIKSTIFGYKSVWDTLVFPHHDRLIDDWMLSPTWHRNSSEKLQPKAATIQTPYYSMSEFLQVLRKIIWCRVTRPQIDMIAWKPHLYSGVFACLAVHSGNHTWLRLLFVAQLRPDWVTHSA